jgi:hypothetical protein
MFSFLNNIPTVTKNILILNVLFYLATITFLSSGVNLIQLLGAHYLTHLYLNPIKL